MGRWELEVLLDAKAFNSAAAREGTSGAGGSRKEF
jgi:hypothetical protein